MDAISYSYADKAHKRIKKFINDPDSSSGIVTVPKVIASGESVTVPAGRVAVLPNVQVDGTMNVNGEVFIPSGSTYSNTNITSANGSFDVLKTQGQNVSPFTGFKNYIINGNFDIWQYKDAGLPYPQTSTGYGSDDRWNNSHNGSTKTHSQVACTDAERALFNASYFSRTVVTSVAGVYNYVIKTQKIENIYKLAGKTVTLSFWAKADSNKKLGISSEVDYGTGGSPSSELLRAGIQQVLDLTTVWKKFTITVTLPTAVGKTLGTNGAHTSSNQITFWFDAGSTIAPIYIPGMIQQSGTFDIAQVQIEEGMIATPFEQRPIGFEELLCKRYYETSINARIEEFRNVINGSTQYGAVRFMVEKRITPTIAVMNDSTMVAVTVCQDNGTIVSASIASSGTTGFRLQWTNTAGRFGASFHYTASAEL